MTEKKKAIVKVKKLLAVSSKILQQKKWKNEVLREITEKEREKKQSQLDKITKKAARKVTEKKVSRNRKKKEIITKKLVA